MVGIWCFSNKYHMTNISLIPKGEVHNFMQDWIPIALCNVLYKVIAKFLANRLKKVLDKRTIEN